MFGGKYGAFRTQNRSFFDQENPIYQEVERLVSIRNQELGLQLGRQYLREISLLDQAFHFPNCNNVECCDIVSWSRLFNRNEYLLVINCNLEEEIEFRVMVDSDLHQPGDFF